ncbi:DUF1127 domain-containing protein [Pseudomonas sp. SP16.1]|uniref:DUF1127 domain-containing protein n=1 Tax=Pseudomonas sp. SP16.1 TaxID=3458854 RepID=UPI0040467B4E
MKGQKGYAVAHPLQVPGLHAGARLRALGRQLRRWWQLAEQRHRLGMLDEAALKDIGLSRADAVQESERPFWDDPLKR